MARIHPILHGTVHAHLLLARVRQARCVLPVLVLLEVHTLEVHTVGNVEIFDVVIKRSWNR